MKRKLLSLFLAALLLTSAVQPALAASGGLSDLEVHWAQAEIEAALEEGWVLGYPDGTFRPEGSITRAEFTKLLLAAIHLTPNHPTAYWLEEHAMVVRDPLTLKKYAPAPFTDMTSHWLTTQGWLDVAVNFGLVVPSDYNGSQFRPAKAITRREIAVMVDRAMGKVYPASQPITDPLPFGDADQIPAWAQGYVMEAVKAGVLLGYPDRTFGPEKTATRAEAVVMVQRMLDYTREGLDPDIALTICYSPPGGSGEDPAQLTTRKVQMQLVDQVLYASLPDILTMQDRLMTGSVTMQWHPIWQQLFVGMDWTSQYRAGTTRFGYFSTFCEVGTVGETFRTPVRMLDGQLMIPIYDFSFAYTNENRTRWDGHWDEESKTLTLYVYNPGYHTS